MTLKFARSGNKDIGREIFYMVEIDLEMCSNVYGQAPCTATGDVGQECYNTWQTCVDRENFTRFIKTFAFVPSYISLPVGLDAYPCIQRPPTITPAKVEMMQGIGSRGAISFTLDDFLYHDHIDPYWRTRTEPLEGTWLGRWLARFPYFKNRPLRIYTGYLSKPFNKDDLSKRLYFIDKMDGLSAKNQVKITAKDILTSLSTENNNAPDISYAWITEDLSIGETAINYEAHPDYPLPAPSGWITIGEEVMHYASNNGSTLSGVTRGAWGTDEREIHEEDDSIQLALFYDSVNIIDVVYDLLVNFGKIDPEYIPYDDWVIERDLWLLPYDVYAILIKPTGIDRIISELCLQFAINVWWDETRQEVRLKSVSPNPLNEQIPKIDDFSNLLEDSVEVTGDDSNQITQLWIWYGIHDPTESLNDAGNFKKLYVVRDPNVENENAFTIPRIRKVYANWIAETQGSFLPTIADRILRKLSANNRKMKFSLDAKDLNFWLMDDVVLRSDKAQSASGRAMQIQGTITKVTEKIPATRFDFEAMGSSVEFDEGERYGFITYNDFPHYDSATDEQKRTGAFASDDDNDFPDGGAPYKII